MSEAEDQRAALREAWEQSSSSWESRAPVLREWGMPVSVWLLDHLKLQPGQRVLELAAGPGDTGFLAAEIVAPGGGSVISSDGAQAMVDVARRRAQELGVRAVEFRQLELEWIDLPTAEVDRIVCRWGLMLILDPAACLQECRRVLRPGGRIAVAVWDVPEANPWMTIPRRALAEVTGASAGPGPGPGPFALASPRQLQDLLEDAGFVDVELDAVELQRHARSVAGFLEETLALSSSFTQAWQRLSDTERARVAEHLRRLARDHQGTDGQLRLRGRSLVAAAAA